MANKLDTEKKTTAVAMLCEGNSIRSIFTLEGHPKAKLAYGWKNFEGDFTAVLGGPPLDSAQTPVKAAIAAKARS